MPNRLAFSLEKLMEDLKNSVATVDDFHTKTEERIKKRYDKAR
jgi:hypothetical protein